MRHASYLTNRLATRNLLLQTPYECFKGKKPNVEHIMVFECVGYTKIETPHLRKLDDRSQALIHLGTEPGSKAYRLLDPTTHRIVLSRDVVFNEEQKWKCIEAEKESSTESGVIDLGFRGVGDQTQPVEDIDNESSE